MIDRKILFRVKEGSGRTGEIHLPDAAEALGEALLVERGNLFPILAEIFEPERAGLPVMPPQVLLVHNVEVIFEQQLRQFRYRRDVSAGKDMLRDEILSELTLPPPHG